MNQATGNTPLDRQDTRVRHDEGVLGALRNFFDRVRSGDLGSLPVIVGLVIIWTVFQTLNPVFLSSNNLVNLLFDCSTIGVISLGIVCVLMLGEIDLSVGSVSGLASAIVGVLWVNHGWPVGFAMLAALCSGALIGLLYAFLYNRFSMPSFVSTLAGLLAALGLQLYLLGNTGSINLPYGSWLVSFGQLLVMPRPLSYAFVPVAGLAIFFTGFRAAGRRREAGLSAPSSAGIALKAIVITIIVGGAVFYLNQSRGVPWMFGLFVALVIAMNYALTRTRWGRSVQAVGGNREAARRAGIKALYVPSSSFGKTQNDLIGGQLDVALDAPSSAKGLIDGGRLRALAITSPQRFAGLPGTPTLEESGMKGYAPQPWIGLMAPAGTPADRVALIQRAVSGVLQEPEMKAQMETLGMIPIGSTPQALAATIDSDRAEMEPLIKELGIKLQ